MELTEIRQLIIAGNVEGALRHLHDIVPADTQNKVELLWTQFNELRQQNLLGSGVGKEDLQRIIYALQSVVSDIESRGLSGLASRRAQAMCQLELDLAKGYAMLSKIRKKTLVDKFLLWMQEYHDPIFREIIRQEAGFGRAPNLPMLLHQVNFAAFIKVYQLKSRPEDALQYFVQKNAECERFFSGWIEYRSRQTQFEEAFEKEIVRTEQQHQKLLQAGLLGGLAGTLAVELLQRGMDGIASHFNSGLLPPDPLPDLDMDDDDDD